MSRMLPRIDSKPQRVDAHDRFGETDRRACRSRILIVAAVFVPAPFDVWYRANGKIKGRWELAVRAVPGSSNNLSCGS